MLLNTLVVGSKQPAATFVQTLMENAPNRHCPSRWISMTRWPRCGRSVASVCEGNMRLDMPRTSVDARPDCRAPANVDTAASGNGGNPRMPVMMPPVCRTNADREGTSIRFARHGGREPKKTHDDTTKCDFSDGFSEKCHNVTVDNNVG